MSDVDRLPASDLTVREQLDRRRVEAIQNEARRGALNDARSAVAGIPTTTGWHENRVYVQLSDVFDALRLAEKGMPMGRVLRAAAEALDERFRVKPDPIVNPSGTTFRADLADTFCFLRRHHHRENPSCKASRDEADQIITALELRNATRAADVPACTICDRTPTEHAGLTHLFTTDV